MNSEHYQVTRQSITESPRARDRWSQMSLKSLQKKTKADNQQKAIKTVVFMLAFFVFCYGLSWFNILCESTPKHEINYFLNFRTESYELLHKGSQT